MGQGRGVQKLSPAIQIAAMENRFPTLRLVGRTPARWIGDIAPIAGGRSFRLEVCSVWGGRNVPRVRVLSPRLVNVPGRRRPPHTFGDGALCLYHTDDSRWDGTQLIAATIIPWACEWCYFYELWLATGEWLGPEYPHDGPKPTASESGSAIPIRRIGSPREA